MLIDDLEEQLLERQSIAAALDNGDEGRHPGRVSSMIQ